MEKKQRFNSNVVYVLMIKNDEGIFDFYGGSHSWKFKNTITERDILSSSGNYLRQRAAKKLITYEEYLSRVKVLFVIPTKTGKEAREMEQIIIDDLFKSIPQRTCNIRGKANKSTRYNSYSTERNKKIAAAHRGLHHSEETKRKISQGIRNRHSMVTSTN